MPRGVSNTDQGFSLGGILAIVVILASLAAGLAKLAVSHIQVIGHSQSALQASNAARSVIAQATAKVLEDESYGRDSSTASTIRYSNDNSVGLLTFHPDIAFQESLVCSTNNLDSTESQLATDGQAVRPGIVRLVARGQSGNVTRRVEVLLEVPQFPWAVASGGALDASAGVLVGSLPEGVWPPVLDELLPADILSNSRDSEAVILGEHTIILGDVQTSGQVMSAAKNVTVKGELLERRQPTDIPLLLAKDYDPLTRSQTFDNLTKLGTNGGPLELSGIVRRQGDLRLDSGLILNKSHFFVDGDLSIQGRLEGSGVLVVTGDLDLRGFANLKGATDLAVLADGKVRLAGLGPEQSKFRGVVYGGNGVEANHLTLVGSLISAASDQSVSLSDMVLVSEPQKAKEISKTFYIGTLDPVNPRYHSESLSDVEPASGSLIELTITRQGSGDFPILVEFSYRGASPPYQWTIHNAQEIPHVNERINWLTDDWTKEPRDAWVEDILVRNPLSQLTDQVTQGSSTGLNVLGELSTLIPAKDRIRVVHWSES